MTITCIVLAGGLGTRLGNLTRDQPKALVKVNGHPFIQYQLKLFKQQGFERIVYSIGHLGSMITDELQEHPPIGLKVEFVSDGDHLLGTGGAVRNVLQEIVLDEFVFITYGDSYLRFDPQDLMKKFNNSQFDAIMSVYPNNDLLDTNNVKMFEDGTILYVKDSQRSESSELNMVDFGMSYIRRSSLLENITKENNYDLANYFELLSKRRRLQGMVVEDRFFEIGSLRGRDQFEKYVRKIELE